MIRINKHWHRFSYLGVTELSSNSDKQRLILANRLNMVLAIIGLVFVGIDFVNDYLFKGFLRIGTLRLFGVFVGCGFNLYLNYLQKIQLSKILLSLIPPFFFMGYSLIIRRVGESDFLWYPYVASALSLIPHFVFDHRAERTAYISSVIINGLFVITIDKLLVWSVPTATVIPIMQSNYLIYKSVQIAIWIFLNLALYYYIRLSYNYEKKLQQSNNILMSHNKLIEKQKNDIETHNELLLKTQNSLVEKNNEIVVQNEELQQQQEEVLAQRDYIRNKNLELGSLNNKLKSSQSILQKAYSKLKEGEQRLSVKNKELEDKNYQITASIRYAQTIQNAILPPEAKMKTLFQDYFVIYKPKDIVAGDFYWTGHIAGKTIVIVADCTGHGVPGAFMSMIGYTTLNKIINEKQIINPTEILKILHHQIREALRQNESENKDGMDVAICVLEKHTEEIQVTYSGAKIPLYWINQIAGLQKINPTRRAIGGLVKNDKPFESHQIILPKNSLIYMASDGMADQNNAKRRKFGSNKIEQIIQKNHTKSLAKQKTIFEQELAQHQLDELQRDDITLIGIKL